LAVVGDLIPEERDQSWAKLQGHLKVSHCFKASSIKGNQDEILIVGTDTEGKWESEIEKLGVPRDAFRDLLLGKIDIYSRSDEAQEKQVIMQEMRRNLIQLAPVPNCLENRNNRFGLQVSNPCVLFMETAAQVDRVNRLSESGDDLVGITKPKMRGYNPAQTWSGHAEMQFRSILYGLVAGKLRYTPKMEEWAQTLKMNPGTEFWNWCRTTSDQSSQKEDYPIPPSHT
jgi:hypothetical protein